MSFKEEIERLKERRDMWTWRAFFAGGLMGFVLGDILIALFAGGVAAGCAWQLGTDNIKQMQEIGHD